MRKPTLFERSEFVGVEKQCAENKLFILSLDFFVTFCVKTKSKRNAFKLRKKRMIKEIRINRNYKQNSAGLQNLRSGGYFSVDLIFAPSTQSGSILSYCPYQEKVGN